MPIALFEQIDCRAGFIRCSITRRRGRSIVMEYNLQLNGNTAIRCFFHF